jgi:hypothetical protein
MTGGTINTYTVNPCFLCGQFLSYNGLAQSSHLNMHAREGYLEKIGSNPNKYKRTTKPFNRVAYKEANPHKYYTRDDYWPSDQKIPKKYRKT